MFSSFRTALSSDRPPPPGLNAGWRAFCLSAQPQFITRQMLFVRVRDAVADTDLLPDILSIIVSYSINSLLIAGAGHTIDVYATHTLQTGSARPEPLISMVEHIKPVLSLALLPNGMIASGAYDKELALFTLLAPDQGNGTATMPVAPGGMSTRSRRYFQGSDSFDERDGSHALLAKRRSTGWLFSMTQTVDGRLITGSGDRDVRLWAIAPSPAAARKSFVAEPDERGWLQCAAVYHGHSDTVSTLAVLNDGKRFVSGCDDGVIKVWRTDPPALVPGVTPPDPCVATLAGHTAAVDCLAVFHSDDRLLSGSYDKTLRIWDMKSYTCLRVLSAHAAPVLCCAILSDGRLASGDGSGVIQLWSKMTYEPQLQLIRTRAEPTPAAAPAPSPFAKFAPPPAEVIGGDPSVPTSNPNPIRSLVVVNAGELISGAQNGDLVRWDLNTNTLHSATEFAVPMTALTALSYF